MKVVDVIVTVPIVTEYMGAEVKVDYNFHGYKEISEKIRYLEELFNVDEWINYHSARYRCEGKNLVVNLTSYTSLLSKHHLRRALFAPTDGRRYVLAVVDKYETYLDIKSMKVDIELPYYVYYVCYVHESDACEEVRMQIECNLISNPLFKEVKVEMLSKCIAIGVILSDSESTYPDVSRLVRAYLEDRSERFIK